MVRTFTNEVKIEGVRDIVLRIEQKVDGVVQCYKD